VSRSRRSQCGDGGGGAVGRPTTTVAGRRPLIDRTNVADLLLTRPTHHHRPTDLCQCTGHSPPPDTSLPHPEITVGDIGSGVHPAPVCVLIVLEVSMAVVFYYYYYAAFNAPCVSHRDDESQANHLTVESYTIVVLLTLTAGSYIIFFIQFVTIFKPHASCAMLFKACPRTEDIGIH